MTGFQFHLVRLKVSSNGHKTCQVKKFQFHLVRLKVRHRNKTSTSHQFQFHLVRLKEPDDVPAPDPTPFQFHLVRLKGIRTTKLVNRKRISIPFSTIKSGGRFSFFIRTDYFNSI